MADLSAVLRKTIDALPAATPQLRAKVYDKARAAVQRQIATADPPLAEEMVEARRRALEEAIAATEAHYGGGAPAAAAPPPVQPTPTPPAPERPAPAAPPVGPAPSWQPAPDEAPPAVEAGRGSPRLEEIRPTPPPAVEAPGYRAGGAPDAARSAPREAFPAAHVSPPSDPDRADGETRIGEIGPVSEPAEPSGSAGGAYPGRGPSIPEADLTAPNYARPRRASKPRGSLFAGLAALLFIGALGAGGYFYRDAISSALTGGGEEVAATGTETPAAQTAATAPAEGETAGQAPAADDPSARQFTQRLLPDGSEVDEGPVESVPNAFDEGTDIAAASVAANEAAVPEAPPAAAATPPAAEQTVDGSEAVPVGQRAVFYEERSADRPGSQRGGNVVWSVVNEPPAAGQPAEPAIRAVADVSGTDLRMTMTIRRNADDTLPASHVIEIMFDTPADFPGGEIENVQRLALKPTEQDRGEPLIGVAGKISDGFFIIALNDLDQAVENNLALMASEQWIDIPMAYSSGQRALMSLEKGIPGERVFQEAMAAWAQQG